MNIQSWIILIVVAVLFVLAIIGDRRRHKSGSGCCSSSECTGDCANCACHCNVGNVEKTDKKNKNKGEKKQ